MWGRPILDHVLDLLVSWGVEEVVINAHHARESIKAYVAARSGSAPRLHFSPEEEILGTGGAIANAAWFVGEEPFWVVNGDVLAELNPAPFIDLFNETGATAVLWMHPTRGPRTVRLEGHRIEDFKTTCPGTENTFTFCGIQLLSPEIMQFIPQAGFSTVITAYEQAMREGRTVLGLSAEDSYWADLGTAQTLLDAHRETLVAAQNGTAGAGFARHAPNAAIERLRGKGVSIDGFLSVGKDCRIEPTATIRDAVLMDRVAVAAGACVSDCIAAPGARLHGKVHGMAMAATDASPTLANAIRSIGWDPAETLLLPLPPRGSARTFSRLRGRGDAGQVVAIEYSLDRPENARFTPNAHFLNSVGIRVPEVIFDDPENRVTLVEDLGETSLLQLARASNESELQALYERVIPSVVQLHTETTRAAAERGLDLCEPFSPGLYEWEHDLFVTHFAKDHLGSERSILDAEMAELGRVSAALLQSTPVLVHRDLQSSNIFFAGDEPAFIDFQGMRYGPAAYDLASLLCDPYVSLPPAIQDRLIAMYAELRDVDREAFEQIFWKAAVQRLVQALGAFGRLDRIRGVSGFKDHIPAAVEMILRALERVGDMPNLWHFFCCISDLRVSP